MAKGLKLKVHLRDREDFHKVYDPKNPSVLFVPTTDPPGAGERLIVEVVFQAGPHVLLHAQVVWRRATGDSRTRAGIGVAIDPADKPKLTYLLGFVRGGLIDVRKKKRLPVRLKVAYTTPQGRRLNFTRDIHEEGAFLRTAEMLEVGSKTELIISPPGGSYRPVTVHATVMRRSEREGERGVGLKFSFSNSGERDRFVAFYRKLEDDYIDGRLPDDAIA